MPRKSLVRERTAQILDAMERCVAAHGLGGTSLELVAQEAGVKRSILRHYVGNRDELVRAMATRLTERYRGELRALVRSLNGPDAVEALLSALFAEPSAEDFRDVVVVEALIAASETDAEVRGPMAELVEATVDAVRVVLRRVHPGADARTAWSVASGVVGLYFNHASLHPLRLAPRHARAALDSARRLVATLP